MQLALISIVRLYKTAFFLQDSSRIWVKKLTSFQIRRCRFSSEAFFCEFWFLRFVRTEHRVVPVFFPRLWELPPPPCEPPASARPSPRSPRLHLSPWLHHDNTPQDVWAHETRWLLTCSHVASRHDYFSLSRSSFMKLIAATEDL